MYCTCCYCVSLAARATVADLPGGDAALLCSPMCSRAAALCAAHCEAVRVLAPKVPTIELQKLPTITNDLLSSLALAARQCTVSSLGPPFFDLMRQAVQALAQVRLGWPAAAAARTWQGVFH